MKGVFSTGSFRPVEDVRGCDDFQWWYESQPQPFQKTGRCAKRGQLKWSCVAAAFPNGGVHMRADKSERLSVHALEGGPFRDDFAKLHMVFLAGAFLIRPVRICKVSRTTLPAVKRRCLDPAYVIEFTAPIHQEQSEKLAEMAVAAFLNPVERIHNALRRAVREKDVYLEMQIYAVKAQDALAVALLAMDGVHLGHCGSVSLWE